MAPLPHLLEALSLRASDDLPGDVYLQDVGGESLTAAQAHDRVLRWASMLQDEGVGPGDAVATMLTHRAEAVIAWLGAAALGAVDVPINPDYRGAMLAHAIEVADCETLVIEARLIARLAPHLRDLPHLQRLLIVGGTDTQPDHLPLRTVDVAKAIHAARPTPRPTPDDHDIACGIFTSGTTGASKCVAVTWAQIRSMYTHAIPLPGAGSAIAYVHSPLHHLVARGQVYRACLGRGRAVIRPKLSIETFWSDVAAYGCTETIATDVVARWLMHRRPRPDDRDQPLTDIILFPMIPDADAFAQRFDLAVSTVYGSTEIGIPFSTVGHSLPWSSCGRLVEGTRVRIVDPENPEHDLADEQIGELLVYADPDTVCAGYFNDDAATAQMRRGSWMATGDAFRRDAQGNYYFQGRYKDAIRRRGENISAMEIEREGFSFPGVTQCAAVGVDADDGSEQEVRLFVTTDATLALDELAAHLTDRLPPFMVPRYLTVLPELPTTPTAKVRKADLRDRPTREDGTYDTVAGHAF